MVDVNVICFYRFSVLVNFIFDFSVYATGKPIQPLGLQSDQKFYTTCHHNYLKPGSAHKKFGVRLLSCIKW